MTGDPWIPSYIGRVLGPGSCAVGTCFGITTNILITACHVLDQLSLEVGSEVQIDGLARDGQRSTAQILAMDPSSDVAVMRSSRELTTPVSVIVLTDTVLPFTQVLMTGVADIEDTHGYDWIDATGEWQGNARRDGLDLGRLESKSVVPGMSGSPVRLASDGAVIGLVSARYNSQDSWMRDSVWIARTEHILDLLRRAVPSEELLSLDVREDPLAQCDGMPEAEFREKAQAALEIAGYDVAADQQIAGQELHLVGRIRRWHKPWLVGVVCLPEREAITEEALRLLWMRYEAVFASAAINELLVVTARPPSLPAALWAESNPRLAIQTLASLIRGALDFERYLKAAARLFTDDPEGLAEYYIPPFTRDGADLETEVLKWIYNDPRAAIPQQQPLAILGSYGLGKTSFAIKLASILATRAIKDDLARVPVLIRLGDIGSEQSLEGLIGAHFTATSPVPGYSFPIFEELNRQGQLIVIFDGFDEMKHLLSWPEFKYNLDQIGRLVVGSSKIILLGRPTAFENDEEHAEALHGRISGPLVTTRDPHVDYFEVELASLESNQIREFLELYLAYVAARGRPFDIERVWRQVQSRQLRDISRRPVQLRMLAKILPEYAGDIEDLNLITLYDTFVDQIIHEVMVREEAKRNRLVFNRTVRREFLARLAFWMWEQRGAGILSADKIPDALVAPYTSGGDISRVRRDLVTASPLDRRFGERIRFAHRSFQEFLVAEEALRRIRTREMDVHQYDRLASDEVAGFLKLLRREEDGPLISGLLRELSGPISWRTADSLLAHPDIVRALEAALRNSSVRRGRMEGKLSSWEILLPFLPLLNSGAQTPVLSEDLVAQARASQDSSASVTLLCLFLACSLTAWQGERESSAIGDILHLLLRGGRGNRELVNSAAFTTKKRAQSHKQDASRREVHQPQASRTAIRAFEQHQYADDRIPFIPLGETFVGDAREGSVRLGRYLSRSYLFKKQDNGMSWDTLAIENGSRADIRWLPDSVIEIARSLPYDGDHADMRSLGKVFAKYLPDAAFIHDWIGPTGLRADLRLPASVAISFGVTTEARNIILAWDKYQRELAEIARQEEVRRRKREEARLRERENANREALTDDNIQRSWRSLP